MTTFVLWFFRDNSSFFLWCKKARRRRNDSDELDSIGGKVKYAETTLNVVAFFSFWQVGSIIRPKQSSATTTEGSSFLFEWEFNLEKDDQRKVDKFIFGLWENGYTSYFLITVTKLGRVIYNPQLKETHPSYVGRVTWAGDISKSYLAYKLVNLTLSDSNTYGCEIDVGTLRRKIHSKITLNVQVRFWCKT